MKKIIILGLFVFLLTTATFAYVATQYNLFTTQEETITIGNTVITNDGIEVSILTKEQGNLTYQSIPKDIDNKHTLTYEYNYTTHIDYAYINVTANDDIVIDNVVITDTIAITFSLNESKDFNEGDVISVVFTFELVEAININTATTQELIDLELSEFEINATLTQRSLSPFTSITDWAVRVGVAGFEQRYTNLAAQGKIVFE